VWHKHSCFSWWWAHSRPKHVEINNINTLRINCAPSWFLFTKLYRGALSTEHKKWTELNVIAQFGVQCIVMFKTKGSVLRTNDQPTINEVWGKWIGKLEFKPQLNKSQSYRRHRVLRKLRQNTFSSKLRQNTFSSKLRQNTFSSKLRQNTFSSKMRTEDRFKQFQLEQVSKLTNACILTIICFLILFTRYHFSKNGSISFARCIQKPANYGPLDETNTHSVCMDLLHLHNCGDDSVAKVILKSSTKIFMYVGFGMVCCIATVMLAEQQR
jgi:hypothetical protein